MTFLEALAEAESFGFSARVNVASDFRTFLRAAANEKTTKALAEFLDDERAALKLLSRVVSLARSEVDYRYEHPRDAAIALYVWLLGERYPLLARAAAEAALMIPRSWWAAHAARSALERSSLKPDTPDVRRTIRTTKAPAPAEAPTRLSAKETVDSPFLAGSVVYARPRVGEGWLMSVDRIISSATVPNAILITPPPAFVCSLYIERSKTRPSRVF